MGWTQDLPSDPQRPPASLTAAELTKTIWGDADRPKTGLLDRISSLIDETEEERPNRDAATIQARLALHGYDSGQIAEIRRSVQESYRTAVDAEIMSDRLLAEDVRLDDTHFAGLRVSRLADDSVEEAIHAAARLETEQRLAALPFVPRPQSPLPAAAAGPAPSVPALPAARG